MSRAEAGEVLASLVSRLPAIDVVRLAGLVEGSLESLRSADLPSAALRGARQDLERLLAEGQAPAFLSGGLIGALALKRATPAVPDVVWSGPPVLDGADRLTPSAVSTLR